MVRNGHTSTRAVRLLAAAHADPLAGTPSTLATAEYVQRGGAPALMTS